MSYENPFGIGTQVLNDLNYNVLSHGDLGAHYDSLVNADLPQYTAKFYSPSETEQIADLRYKKIEIGYDKGMKDLTEAFQGIPMEAYIPAAAETSDTGSSSPSIRPQAEIVIKNPRKEIVEEIIRAQREVAGRELVLEQLDVEEIIIRRRFRRIKVKDLKK